MEPPLESCVLDRAEERQSGKSPAVFQRSTAWTRTLLLTRQSFGILRRDKKLLAFPIAAGLSAICVAVSFMRPMFDDGSVRRYLDDGRFEAHTALWLFLWYYFHYFVILFFNSALIASANARMAGKSPSIKLGIQAAIDRLFPISMWTLTASTVGIVIRLIESRSTKLASWVTAFVGLTWTFATYFVGPVLMFEEASVVPAVRRSVQITRRTWGEQLTNHASFGVFTLLLAIPGLALAVAGMFFVRALLLPALLYGLMLSVILSAARTIFTVALYRYAVTGEVPDGFSADVITGTRAK
jgi:hypothetical protein